MFIKECCHSLGDVLGVFSAVAALVPVVVEVPPLLPLCLVPSSHSPVTVSASRPPSSYIPSDVSPPPVSCASVDNVGICHAYMAINTCHVGLCYPKCYVTDML